MGKAMDLSKEKEKVEVQLEEYMAEWEELRRRRRCIFVHSFIPTCAWAVIVAETG